MFNFLNGNTLLRFNPDYKNRDTFLDCVKVFQVYNFLQTSNSIHFTNLDHCVRFYNSQMFNFINP